MSSDRELLELAAKAAGIEGEWDEEWGGVLVPVKVFVEEDGIQFWNPLTEDGDALRLAVKLRLNILPDGPGIERQTVEVSGNTGAEVEPWAWETLDGGDPYAATRRAIVRAAAEIGKATQ